MIQEFFELMGRDTKTGKPYRRTLEVLGLDDVTIDIWNSRVYGKNH
jgi:hypothetical protein